MLTTVLSWIWSAVGLLLIGSVLLHSPKGDGMGGLASSGGSMFSSARSAEDTLNRISWTLLGLFLLAVANPRVKQPAALMGFVVGVTGLSMLAMGTDLYWPWYAAVGSLLTWVSGILIQFLTPAGFRSGESPVKEHNG